MIKVFVTYSIFLFFFLTRVVSAQDISSPEILRDLTSIETNTALTNENKIASLLQLQKLCKIKDSVYARIVHRLGVIYNITGNIAYAITLTKEALAVNSFRSAQTEKAFLANSYFNLGSFSKSLFLYDDMERYLDSSIFISTQFPHKYFIAPKAFHLKAYAFFQVGDYQKAIQIADNGILFCEKVKDTLSEALLLSQKAQAQIELGSFNEAEENIKKAISIFEQTGLDTIGMATAFSIYASLLNEKGDQKKAIAYYEKSFRLNKTKKNLVQCSRDMLDLGLLYDNQLHNYAKAIACYNSGIKMIEQTNDFYQLVALYTNSGVVYWRQKNYKKALQVYQKGLNALPVNFADTIVTSNPGHDKLKLVANEYIVSALLANKGEALLDEYKIEKRKELLQAALNTFVAADKAIDFMRWKQNGEQSKLFWREQTKYMYEKAIEACYLSKDIEKGYYFFEKSRAVLLNDKLSELGAKRFITPTDRLNEQQLKSTISLHNQQLSALKEGTPQYKNTWAKLQIAQNEEERFIKSLDKKYPSYYQYKYDNSVDALQQVKKLLQNSKQSLIEFFNTADSGIYVLVVSNNGARIIKIAFNNYTAVVKEFMRLCSDKSRLNQNYARYRLLAYQLYEKLFKPLNVPAGRVIISPDDYFIPFEALLLSNKDPTSFLLKDYAFSYAYSMGLLTKIMHHSAAKNSFLGIAPITFKPYLNQQSLEGSDQSLKNIERHFNSADLLTYTKANKNSFLKNVGHYEIVQVYSHADADSSKKQPVLYLNDSAINISELQLLEDLHTDMIVLSACRTGIGKNAKGEGVFSLARAFIAAGIPTTVTTLWQVENQSTYLVTELFYKYMSKGLPKDVALQKAKLEFIQSNGRVTELPYSWAANILLGKSEAIRTSKTNKIFIIAIVSSVVLLMVVLFRKLYYRKLRLKV